MRFRRILIFLCCLGLCSLVMGQMGCRGGQIRFGEGEEGELLILDEDGTEVALTTEDDEEAIVDQEGLKPVPPMGEPLKDSYCKEPPKEEVTEGIKPKRMCLECARYLPLDVDLVGSVSPVRLSNSPIFRLFLGSKIEELEEGVKELENAKGLPMPFKDKLTEVRTICLGCMIGAGPAFDERPAGVDSGEETYDTKPTDDAGGTGEGESDVEYSSKVVGDDLGGEGGTESSGAEERERDDESEGTETGGEEREREREEEEGPEFWEICGRFVFVIEGGLDDDFSTLENYVNGLSDDIRNKLQESQLFPGGPKVYVRTFRAGPRVIVGYLHGRIVIGTPSLFAEVAAKPAVPDNTCPLKEVLTSLPEASLMLAGNKNVVAQLFRDPNNLGNILVQGSVDRFIVAFDISDSGAWFAGNVFDAGDEKVAKASLNIIDLGIFNLEEIEELLFKEEEGGDKP